MQAGFQMLKFTLPMIDENNTSSIKMQKAKMMSGVWETKLITAYDQLVQALSEIAAIEDGMENRATPLSIGRCAFLLQEAGL